MRGGAGLSSSTCRIAEPTPAGDRLMMAERDSADFHSIPVLDVAPLFGADVAAAMHVAHQIREASIRSGFFYVRGHNISRDLMNATYLASKYFFNLPEESKRAISVGTASAHRGYVPIAQTRQPGVSRADLKESFNFAYPFTPEHPAMAAGHTLIGV